MNFSIYIERTLVRELEHLHSHARATNYLYEQMSHGDTFIGKVACKAIVDRIYAGQYDAAGPIVEGETETWFYYCVSWQIVDPTKPMIMEVTCEPS